MVSRSVILRLIQLVLTGVLVVSCSHAKRKNNPDGGLSPTKVLTYEVGFPCNHRFNGNVKLDDNELLYFADVTTYKKIKLFTIDGEVKYTVELNGFFESAPGSVIDLAIVGMDTIGLLMEGGNRVYWMDFSGTIWDTTNLVGIENHIHESSTYFPFAQSGSMALLGVRYHNNDYEEGVDMKHWIRRYYENYNAAPALVRVDGLFDPLPKMVPMAEKFYFNLDSANTAKIGSIYYTYDRDHAYIFSAYSSWIVQYRLKDGQLVKRIDVSEYHPELEGCPPIKLDDDGVKNLQSYVNEGLQTSSQINRLWIDEAGQKFYLIVYGKQTADEIKRSGERRWSLLVLDSSLQLLAKYQGDKRFIPGDMIITHKGTLMAMPDSNLSTSTYALFEDI